LIPPGEVDLPSGLSDWVTSAVRLLTRLVGDSIIAIAWWHRCGAVSLVPWVGGDDGVSGGRMRINLRDWWGVKTSGGGELP